MRGGRINATNDDEEPKIAIRFEIPLLAFEEFKRFTREFKTNFNEIIK